MNANHADRAVAIAHLIRGAVEIDRNASGRLSPAALVGAIHGFLVQWAADDPAYVLDIAESMEASAVVLREEVARQSAMRGAGL